MDAEVKPLGVVLCGGESSRMGVDKSLLNYHGRTQQEHVKKLLLPFCSAVVFSTGTRDDSSEEAFPDLPEFMGNGPLSGLLSVHEFFPNKDILLIGCDYPLILQSQIGALIPQTPTKPDACCYVSGTPPGPEPLLAWYAASFCTHISETFKNSGANSLRRFLEQGKIRTLSMDNAIHLFSADHPEDVERVCEIIQGGFDTFV